MNRSIKLILRCIVALGFIFLSFISTANAATYSKTFMNDGKGHEWYITVTPGTHTFKVSGVPKGGIWPGTPGSRTEWYINGAFEDTFNTYVTDPSYNYGQSSGSYRVSAEIYDGTWNWLEAHHWNVTVNRPPGKPGTPTFSDKKRTGAKASWSGATDPDGDTVSYTVAIRKAWHTWGSGTEYNTGTTRSKTFTALDEDTEYYVRVCASDSKEGGVGNWSDADSFRTLKNNRPEVPGTLSAPSSHIGQTSARVVWGASSDPDGDSVSYRYRYRKSSSLLWGTTYSTGNTYVNLTGLDADTEYDFEVWAIDSYAAAESNKRRTDKLFKTLLTPGNVSATLTWPLEHPWNGAPAPASLTRFVRWPDGQEVVGSNPGTFTELTPGGYWIEGYQKGPFTEYEYWGSAHAQVDGGKTKNVTINRHTPYCKDFWFEYNGVRIEPDDYIPPGATLVPKAEIRNKDTSDNNWYVYVTIGWRFGNSGSAVGTRQSSTFSVGKNSTTSILLPSITLQSGTEGDLHAYIKTSSKNQYIGWNLTDSWSWTKRGIVQSRLDAIIVPGSVQVPNKSIKAGEQANISLRVRNTGDTKWVFYVGLSLKPEWAGEWPDGWYDIEPKYTSPLNSFGGEETVTFTFDMPVELPLGSYEAYLAVWKNYDPALDPFDPGQMIGRDGEPGAAYDRWSGYAFTKEDSGAPDPYGLEAYDTLGLFTTIPLEHRNNLIDLTRLHLNVLKGDGGVVLDQNHKNLIFVFHGWNLTGNEEAYSGEKWVNLLSALRTQKPVDWTLIPYDWNQDADTEVFPKAGDVIKNAAIKSVAEHLKIGIGDLSLRVDLLERRLELSPYMQEVVTAVYEASPSIAAMRGYQHGLMTAKKLAEQNVLDGLQKVQIISFSAGTWPALALAQALADRGAGDLAIQVVYCDPFIPAQATAVLSIRAQAFNSLILERTATLTRSNTEDAVAAQVYWTDGLADITWVFKKPTKVLWEWDEGEGLVLNIRKEFGGERPKKWFGHAGPVYFYTDTIYPDPEDTTFRGYGWKKSLAYNHKASIIFQSPNGGEVWQRGTTWSVAWDSVADTGSNVKIDLYRNSGTAFDRTIVSSAANTGQYNWPIPSNLPERNDYRIRITSTSDAAIWDQSDGSFSVIAPSTQPILQVTPSNYNVSYNAGSRDFTVSNAGTGTINWAASVISGSSWLSIATGSGGTITASYDQNTDTNSRTGTIRVTATGATGSPHDVTIQQGSAPSIQTATITITVLASPSNGGTVSGGGTFVIGSSRQISASANLGWTFTGWNDGSIQNPRTISVSAGGATYEATFTEVGTVATPAFNPGSGLQPASSVDVMITCATEGATIRYTTDASIPTEASPAVASGGVVTIPVPGILTAKAWKEGMNSSAIKTAGYSPAELAQPPAFSGSTRHTSNLTPEWSWSSGGGGTGVYRYKLNSNDFSSGATETTGTTYTPLSHLAKGLHTLYVQEQDAFGNWSESGSFTIMVDTSAPQIVQVTPANRTGIDTVSRISNNASFGVRVEDSGGIDLTDPEAIEFEIRVDAPGGAGDRLDDRNLSHTQVRTVQLAFENTDVATHFWAVYDKASDTPAAYPFDAVVEVAITVVDKAGHSDQQVFSFRVESEPEHNYANNPANFPPTTEMIDGGSAIVEVTGGALEGARLVYIAGEPLSPYFGPVDNDGLPLLDVADGVGTPLNLKPPTVFNNPVTIYIPCPGYSSVNNLTVYYYNGTEWVLACNAAGQVQPGGEGWMVPGSRVNHNSSTILSTIEIQVNHFSAVQAGLPLSSGSGSGGSSGGGEGGGGGGGCFVSTVGASLHW